MDAYAIHADGKLNGTTAHGVLCMKERIMRKIVLTSAVFMIRTMHSERMMDMNRENSGKEQIKMEDKVYLVMREKGLSDNFWVKPMKIGESGDQY